MRRRVGHISHFILIFIMIVLGCDTKETTLPQIRYGEETCDRCRMIISEKRFAAAYRTVEDVPRKFDDFGCAILHQIEQDEQVKQFWVYDYKESAWLDTAHAFFVQSTDVLTPMGYGVAAVKTESEAQRLANSTNGQIVEFNQLQHILKREKGDKK